MRPTSTMSMQIRTLLGLKATYEVGLKHRFQIGDEIKKGLRLKFSYASSSSIDAAADILESMTLGSSLLMSSERLVPDVGNCDNLSARSHAGEIQTEGGCGAAAWP
ncbi:hypothetical protein Dimus_027276, partial [Dionaea muscipula]